MVILFFWAMIMFKVELLSVVASVQVYILSWGIYPPFNVKYRLDRSPIHWLMCVWVYRVLLLIYWIFLPHFEGFH